MPEEIPIEVLLFGEPGLANPAAEMMAAPRVVGAPIAPVAPALARKQNVVRKSPALEIDKPFNIITEEGITFAEKWNVSIQDIWIESSRNWDDDDGEPINKFTCMTPETDIEYNERVKRAREEADRNKNFKLKQLYDLAGQLNMKVIDDRPPVNDDF